MNSRFLFFLFTFLIFSAESPAGVTKVSEMNMPALETLVIKPVAIENLNFWVPAAKSGPFINRSCRIKRNLSISSVLPATVKHEKTESCPGQAARVLAEVSSFYHTRSLPLTIFNGWRWEHSYSMCQFESVSYDLANRGGSWENGWEAILNYSVGNIELSVLKIGSPSGFLFKRASLPGSTIEVKTFSSMRTRNGYPKERKL